MVVVGEFEGELAGVGSEGNLLRGSFEADFEGESHERILPKDSTGINIHRGGKFMRIGNPLGLIDGFAGEERTL